MKISYRTHPVLGMINGQGGGVMIGSDSNEISSIQLTLQSIFKEYKGHFTENIISISESFYEATMKAGSKMIDNELYKDIGDNLSGVVLFGKNTVVYKANRTVVNGVGAWELNIAEFYTDHKDVKLVSLNWGRIKYTIHPTDKSPDAAAKSVWTFVQSILMFKKFAQVETKYMPCLQCIKGIDCKYVNETDSNITYLTSAWFTNLVKSDAFNVRGHFRLQPKKKVGEWTKELIWISDFVKDGYTAPARKLKEEING